MTKNKQSQNRTRHDFLLTFFKKDAQNGAWIEINGYFLEKQVHEFGVLVAIYPKESWQKREFFNDQKQHMMNI